MKISVVMAYYNRKKHLVNTLWSMSQSKYKNFEVIVVDDASDEEHRINDLKKQFNFLKTYRIRKDHKKHTNPCIPLNKAISMSTGDIIIIQNPECFHFNDVFSHVVNNIEENKYLAYSVVNRDIVNKLNNLIINGYYYNNVNDLINERKNKHKKWYCHSINRPKALNFCTAITRDDLKELNGFDERYAFGIERDDVEFLDRIQRKGMDIVFVDDIVVIHQSHKPFYYSNYNSKKLKDINHNLYKETTEKENIIKVNPLKIIL